MRALLRSRSRLDRGAAWLLEVLREDLRPYPGRFSVVARMVVSSVIAMLLLMVFRIPGGALAGYYALLLSRESPETTLAAGLELLLSFCAGLGYVILSAQLFFGSPVLHFLWVVISFFVIFFAIRTIRSFGAAIGFGFLILSTIPFWDGPGSAELALDNTLWMVGVVALGVAVTTAIEYLVVPFHKYGALEEGLLDRWTTIEKLLRAYAEGGETKALNAKIHQFALVGVSRLRRLVLRSGEDREYLEQMGAIVSFSEHLVDLLASLEQLKLQPTTPERMWMEQAASVMAKLPSRLLSRDPAAPQPEAVPLTLLEESETPLLPEIGRQISTLAGMCSRLASEEEQISLHPPQNSLFVPDAFTNPDHILYGLKGCLAASLCYIFYNTVDWRGLNTSIATCVVTALSSVGSSRQRQLLRILGALFGGVVLGMGAQIYVLPYIDSITGFTLLFGGVTALCAWIATASARLSYFGLQVALGFFLIHLQEPVFQTSLSIARDRVVGTLLGLIMVWVIFDLAGGVRAVEQMAAKYRRNISLLARLQELSMEKEAETIERQVRSIRDELINNFATLNSEADAVLLETGPQREPDLALREQILAMQPALRSLLLLQVTALQYRKRRLLHELPPRIAEAQRKFDTLIACHIRYLAGEGAPLCDGENYHALQHLREEVYSYYHGQEGGKPSPAAEAMLSLSASIAAVLDPEQSRLRPLAL